MLERTGRLPGQKEQGFTTVGKAKMASKQYNSPMAMYSEDIIEEIMTQVCQRSHLARTGTPRQLGRCDVD